MVLCVTLSTSAFGQSLLAPSREVTITSPPPPRYVGPVLRPFHLERRVVSPAKLTNTPRLESLVRAGNLYLSVDDVIALALENNIDIAIQRYGPLLAQEVLRRAEGGGALRSVGVAINPGPVSVSLAGVSSSTVGLGGGSGVTSGGGVVAQVGEIPPNLDPSIFVVGNFSHTTTPLSNQLVSLIPSIQQNTRQYQAGYSQSWATGTNAQLTFVSTRVALNSPAGSLNPFTQGFLDLTISQNLLQGWGRSVNNRYIHIAKNNMKVTDLQLRLQVITTVAAILNLYWDLVSFNEDMRIKEKALATSQKLYDDNKRQTEIGTLAGIEVTRAAAQVSLSKEDLLISQTNVAQQEIVLKNALSRNGAASAWLDDVHIIPLDKVVVPEKDELKPTAELIEEALASRAEIEQGKINLESNRINLRGTKNALLPTLSAFVDFTNNGLTGSPNALCPGLPFCTPDSYVVGGYGNFLGEVFRRNYPSYSAGFSLNIPFRNRAAQADYVTDQLSMRQSELQLQRSVGQVRVDVRNAVIGLQQARARYETAVATRVLAQQTLDAEEKRFSFGQSTIPLVVQAQRDLATDETAEIQAMANYTHAKIAFDEAVGQTLEMSHIKIEEAASGHVARQSSIPDTVPNQKP